MAVLGELEREVEARDTGDVDRSLLCERCGRNRLQPEEHLVEPPHGRSGGTTTKAGLFENGELTPNAVGAMPRAGIEQALGLGG